jgi:large subunit ribosomal protein L18
MKLSKERSRSRVHFRIRKKIKGVASSPRLSVFRSNKIIYAQIIDDAISHTLVAADSRENGILGNGTKVEQAFKVGQLLAEKAREANISKVVFDRSGYLYHGRVKSLADGAREGGLQF